MTDTETNSRDASRTLSRTGYEPHAGAAPSPPQTIPLPSRREVVLFAAIFALAFAARLAFLALEGPFVEPDSQEYFLLARNLREHGVYSMSEAPPFEPSIRRPPLYPAFLAAFGWTSKSSRPSIAVAQCLVDAVTSMLLLGLGRMVVSRAWALAVAVVYAIHPGPISYASTMISEPLFTLLLVASVLVLARGLTKGTWRLTAAGFAGIGIASLCRAIALPLPFVFTALVLATRQVRVRRAYVWLLVSCALLVVVPWLVRSSVLAGRFVPVHTGSSVNVYEPSRVTQDGARDPFYQKQDSAKTPGEQVDVDRIGLALALENIRRDPLLYLQQRAAIYPYLFLTSFDRFTGIDAGYSALYAKGDFVRIAVKVAMLVVFAAVPFALGLVGLRGASSSPAALLCAGVWCYTLLVHVPLWIEYRFWLPALPFLLVSAAAGMEELNSRLRHPGASHGEYDHAV